MKEFKSETIVISKEAWKYLWNVGRKKEGEKMLNDEQLDAIWERIKVHNGGANPETHPINKNEHRVDKYTFAMSLSDVKTVLKENGYTYREDGYVAGGFYF